MCHQLAQRYSYKKDCGSICASKNTTTKVGMQEGGVLLTMVTTSKLARVRTIASRAKSICEPHVVRCSTRVARPRFPFERLCVLRMPSKLHALAQRACKYWWALGARFMCTLPARRQRWSRCNTMMSAASTWIEKVSESIICVPGR